MSFSQGDKVHAHLTAACIIKTLPLHHSRTLNSILTQVLHLRPDENWDFQKLLYALGLDCQLVVFWPVSGMTLLIQCMPAKRQQL